MNDADIELLKKEGFESDDEIEDFLTQEIIDVKNDFKFSKIENQVKHKFILHNLILISLRLLIVGNII